MCRRLDNGAGTGAATKAGGRDPTTATRTAPGPSAAGELGLSSPGAGTGRGRGFASTICWKPRAKTRVLIASALPCGQSHVSPEKGVEAFHGFSEVAQKVPRRRCQ